ncbi:MAG: tRNA (guanosine(46)-N7)-methyltransferase TrmB, partial [Cyanobacteriota bacterium]|nr:tRNA (guanosine(46)-N7)-methyltransferase TrmB [Cyanobacteriota bacterium]
MARVRVRQHVNPLSRKYQIPRTPPNWEKIFARPLQPLHLDIGCARGRFLLKMAQLEPHWNFLGLEIREPLVEEANDLRDRLGLRNLHYLFCNVNIDLASLLQSLPPAVLQTITIQFPDPWFKKRHEKRRTVQPELADTLARYAIAGGCVFLQSDVEVV